MICVKVDSLSGLIQQHMQLNILNGGIFIFINKKRNQVKLLLWEGDGLALYYKRLLPSSVSSHASVLASDVAYYGAV